MHTRRAESDPVSLERGVRQALADKVSGSHLGMWLLVAEHLRLGTWDLLLGWAGRPAGRVEPRLALQLVHEAAMCVAGLRANRSLPQASFGLLSGLPFLASDPAVHDLLAGHSVEDALRLQRGLGLRRQAQGDFVGRLLVIDPHRVRSHSKRHVRRRRKSPSADPAKLAQTFFALDADTRQPVCFTTGTAARTASQATPGLLDLAAEVLPAREGKALVVADAEHFSVGLMGRVSDGGRFDLLVPVILRPKELDRLRGLDPGTFTPRWAGYATARLPYRPARGGGPYTLLVQRFGERAGEYKFNAFVCTGPREELEMLTGDYPKRWHIEEFFNLEQGLGWDRAGSQNLNIRYGQMTMALVAQAALCGLRRRLGEPYAGWEARHLARDLLSGLEGDVRVTQDTIIVTYYNAPDACRLRGHYEGLPARLCAEGLDPAVPWLYGYKLDFRFR
jgi:Transposase DDE domain